MKKYILIIIALFVLFASCSKKKTIYGTCYIYSDVTGPYGSFWSTNGYNKFYFSFAGYQNEFMGSKAVNPGKFIVNDTISRLCLTGKNIYNGKGISVTINFKNFTPESYLDLLLLEKKVYDFADTSMYMTVFYDNIENQIVNGDFLIRELKPIRVNQQVVGTIFSGNFGGDQSNYYEGHFDVIIGDGNFVDER